jgi:cytochrome c peroxidase
MRVVKSSRPLLIALTLAGILAGPNVIAKETEKFGPLPKLKVNQAKAELGKRLFFDTRLSGNAQLSCASCHNPEQGYSQNIPLSIAYTGSLHFRNAPTLINTAYKPSWFHDGRIGTNLNDVTRESITEDHFMNMDMRLMQERIKQDPIYVQMFKDAGYGEPSNGSVRKAIPEYLQTLTSKNVPFDNNKLNDSAQRGFDLFKGKGNCASCHNGATFSDGLAHNTGVPENFEIFRDPMRHHTFIAFNMFMGVSNYMNLKRDVGAHVQIPKADGSNMGKFMTPSLRELKQTAPYMHNGMIATLPEVIEFYNAGGGADSNKSEQLTPLNLTEQEKKDLVAFLEALSGDKLTGKAYVYDKNDYSYQLIKDWKNTKN